MLLNIYLLVLLYFISIFVFVLYFIVKVRNKELLIIKKQSTLLFFLLLFSLFFSTIIGYLNYSFPSDHAFVDITRILNFSTIFATPFVLAFTNLRLFNKYYEIFKTVAIFYTILTALSFIFGSGESIFYGGLFGPTTVNLGMISIFFFIALHDYQYFPKKKNLILLLISYFVIIISLSKWNLIAILAGFYFIYIYIMKQLNSKNSTKYLFITLSVSLLLLFIIFSKQIFDIIAQINQFDDFENYLDGRVFRQMTNNSQVESGIGVMVGDDYGIKDGARFLVWLDLITKTLKSPFIGLGLGVRAFGEDMEDHSMIIFFFARFGIILFLILFFLQFKIFLRYFKLVKNSLSKPIFLILILHFYFQASVGNIWGQLPYDLLLGLFFSRLLIFHRHKNEFSSN